MKEEKFIDSAGFLLMFTESLSQIILDKLQPQDRERVQAVINFRLSLDSETDRGCALMAAAFIDEQLSLLLKSYFVDDSSVVKVMFKSNGPFSSFESKIDVSYAMGLISFNTRHDIHLLRRIRNEFAHISTPMSFEDEKISSRCNELKLQNKSNDSRARGKFTRSMIIIVCIIENSLRKLQRRDVIGDYDSSEFVEAINQLKKFLNERGSNWGKRIS